MKTLIAFTTVCALLVWSHWSKSDDSKPAHVAYTEHFLKNYPERLEKALKLIPVVEGHSAINAIDPLVVVVVIACESSWKIGAVGKVDELGLMQVHGTCARGYDLSQPDEQISAGTRCLAAARDACDGSLLQTLSMFQSGSCEPRTPTTRRRIERRVRIIEKWRNN